MKKRTTGQQIQNIAEFLCAIGWFASVLCCTALFKKFSIFAVLIGAIGAYATWACTCVLRGFGELIEDTAANRENTDRIVELLASRLNTEE